MEENKNAKITLKNIIQSVIISLCISFCIPIILEFLWDIIPDNIVADVIEQIIYLYDDFTLISYSITAIIMFLILLNCNRKIENSSKKSKFIIIKWIVYILVVFLAISCFMYIANEAADLSGMDYKPIIYLYPQQEAQAEVKLGYPNAIICSYPEYPQEGWKVIASPQGNLQDLKTGKNLYSLYYESKTMNHFKIEDDGFIVKKEEVATFLEEKLEILGLTQREAEEFIIYWLPKLQENEYNYIRFASEEEINKSMPLEINPNPDTIIRVLMTFKGLNKPINVKEQKLTTPERKGFVAVEWGGTEIE